MGKVLKGILGVVLTVMSFVPGLNVLGLGAKALLAVGMAGISMTLSAAAEALFGPKTPKTQLSRLNVSLDPSTPRKAVLGTTAMPLDLRYHESSGTNQEYIDYIICVAAHKVKSIQEIWFEEKIAWTSAGGVDSRYTGYLTVATVLEGNSSNYISINGGAKWGSTRRLTGCAYVHLRIKRTGNDKKAESPLVNGLPSRVTITGEGAYMYDPRKDSTVAGGSGSHRANDQTTWGTYTNADDVDNPALQLLWWLLGWKINSKLSIGCGVPSARLDLESFITAANICDEDITLSGGGTQKRYRTSATASDADNRMDIINTFLSCMNGTLRDNDGKLTLTVMKNDLANYVLSFNDNDVLEDFEWNQTRGITDTYNVARGRYIDPSNNSLYQMLDYPEIRIDSIDGIERVVTIDLPYVEDGKRAQRIAKQVLQRNQYRGMFSATFTAKALGCQVGDVVRLTFAPLGWTNKLFRVISQQIDFSGKVPLALVEENAAIYAWDADESAPVTPTAPTIYDPLNNPLILGIDEADGRLTATVNLFKRTATTTAPSVVTTGTAVYTFSTGSITGQPTGWTIASPDIADGAYLWIIKSVALSTTDTADILNTSWSSPVLFVQNGANGTAAISGSITNENVGLFAYADGTVSSYAPATGSFVIVSGTTDVSSNFTLSIPTGGNPQSLTYTLVNRTYTVTGGFDANEDTASLTIRATGGGAYSGITIDKVLNLSKTKGGYEIVTSLPSTNLFEGRVIYLTTDDKLYRYTGTAWSKAVDGEDLVANSVTTNALDAGSVTAAKLAVTQLDAISATIGTLRTNTTGARMEIRDNVIKIYDGSNVLRVKIGNLSL